MDKLNKLEEISNMMINSFINENNYVDIIKNIENNFDMDELNLNL